MMKKFALVTSPVVLQLDTNPNNFIGQRNLLQVIGR